MDLQHLLPDELDYELALRRICRDDADAYNKLQQFLLAESFDSDGPPREYLRLTRQASQREFRECELKVSEIEREMLEAVKEADDQKISRCTSRLMHVDGRVRRLDEFDPGQSLVAGLKRRIFEQSELAIQSRDTTGSGQGGAIDEDADVDGIGVESALTIDERRNEGSDNPFRGQNPVTVQQRPHPQQPSTSKQAAAHQEIHELVGHQTAQQMPPPTMQMQQHGIARHQQQPLHLHQQQNPVRFTAPQQQRRQQYQELSPRPEHERHQIPPHMQHGSLLEQQRHPGGLAEAPYRPQPRSEAMSGLQQQQQYEASQGNVANHFQPYQTRQAGLSYPAPLVPERQSGYSNLRPPTVQSTGNQYPQARSLWSGHGGSAGQQAENGLAGGHRIHQWSLRFGDEKEDLDADEFMFRVERQAQLHGVTERALSMGFGGLLVGRPLQWFWTFQRKYGDRPWPELRDEFVVRFGVHRGEADHEIRAAMEGRKQLWNEPFSHFCQDIEAMAVRLIHPIGEPELVALLRRNMQMELRKALWRIPTRDIRGMLQSCAEYEDMCKEERRMNNQRRMHRVSEISDNPQFDEIQGQAEQYGYVEAVQASGGRSSLVICWNCHDIGHVFNECLQPRSVFCFSCGKSGVVRTDCPKCSGNLQRDGSKATAFRSGNQVPQVITKSNVQTGWQRVPPRPTSQQTQPPIQPGSTSRMAQPIGAHQVSSAQRQLHQLSFTEPVVYQPMQQVMQQPTPAHFQMHQGVQPEDNPFREHTPPQ